MKLSCLFDKHVVVFHDVDEFITADFNLLILKFRFDVQIHFLAAIPWLFLAYRFDKLFNYLRLFLFDFF